MFRELKEGSKKEVVFFFEGKKLTAFDGETIASALLRSGEIFFRESKKHNYRGPFCMIGICFECLVDVDQMQSIQACQVIVKNNMQVKRHKTSHLSL